MRWLGSMVLCGTAKGVGCGESNGSEWEKWVEDEDEEFLSN